MWSASCSPWFRNDLSRQADRGDGRAARPKTRAVGRGATGAPPLRAYGRAPPRRPPAQPSSALGLRRRSSKTMATTTTITATTMMMRVVFDPPELVVPVSAALGATVK